MTDIGFTIPEDISPEQRMATLIASLSAYIEQVHGGTIRMESFDGETLKVTLGGACVGCPLASATVHGWIEGNARTFFPELKQVLAREEAVSGA